MRDYFCVCNTDKSFVIRAASFAEAWDVVHVLYGTEYEGIEKVVKILEV